VSVPLSVRELVPVDGAARYFRVTYEP